MPKVEVFHVEAPPTCENFIYLILVIDYFIESFFFFVTSVFGFAAGTTLDSSSLSTPFLISWVLISFNADVACAAASSSFSNPNDVLIN